MNAEDIHPERTSTAQKVQTRVLLSVLKADMGEKEILFLETFILDVKDIS